MIYLPFLTVNGQDTNFVNKHQFETPVRNVFKAGEDLYVKTGNGLFKMAASGWVPAKLKFSKRFVFFEKDFFETDYIPNHFVFDAKPLKNIIPQPSLTASTAVMMDDRLFVSVGGSLFEFSINKYFFHSYKDCSIRDIYLNPNLKVVSTYSGIFIQDTLWNAEPVYSSGPFCKVLDNYYLCSDQLYLFKASGVFEKIPTAVNAYSGLIRNMIDFKGKVYSMNTKSVNLANENFELKPIHMGYDYVSLAKTDNLLLFSTNSGEIFKFDGNTVSLLINLKTPVKDIYPYGGSLYFSTDNGVYQMKGYSPDSVQMIARLPSSLKVVFDLFNNLWISTENGLFILPEHYNEPILFIDGVEFNRGALTYYEDNLYAGSTSGLYTVNIYTVVRNFLPLFLNSKKLEKKESNLKRFVAAIIIISLLSFSLVYYYEWKKGVTTVILPQTEVLTLTLDKMENDIIEKNIITVEGLAENYQTNTVQLNRIFKTFDTTPGKFMRMVKLKYASQLLEKGISISEVVVIVGYSAGYLKKELNL